MNPIKARPEPGREPRRRWAISTAPRGLVLYFAVLEVAAAVGLVVSLFTAPGSRHVVAQCLLIMVLAISFEEITRKFGQLRIKINDYLKADMTSVWSFSAAIVLPVGYAMILVGALLYYRWYRIQRAADGVAYRKIGSAAVVLIVCLVVGSVVHSSDLALDRHTNQAGASVTVLIALLVYAAVARLLITLALSLLGVRGRDLIGSSDDNVVELATLCLGGLVALALVYQPWLALLALLPMGVLQRAAVVKQLEVVATRDAKTGLLNATVWDQLAQRELARSEREHRPSAVVILDLDRFKKVNDTWGHLVGDLVLKAVSRTLTNELRGYDLVGRFGGEEFVAFLPGVTPDVAVAIAERLRVAVGELRMSDFVADPVPVDGGPTVSVGVACDNGCGAGLAELLYAADAALYSAKSLGRNRVAVAGDQASRAGSIRLGRGDGVSPSPE